MKKTKARWKEQSLMGATLYGLARVALSEEGGLELAHQCCRDSHAETRKREGQAEGTAGAKASRLEKVWHV